MLAVKRRTITLRWVPPVGGPRKRRPGALAASCEGHLRMTDRGLGVMLCSPRQGRFGRRPVRRNPGGEVSILGVPFRPGPAHVVQVGPIRTAGSTAFAETQPQPADGINKIAPHQTLPLPLVEGVFLGRRSHQTHVLISNGRFIRLFGSNLKKWCDCGSPQRSTLKIVEELVAVVTAGGDEARILSQRAEIRSGMWPASEAKRKLQTKVATIMAASMVANPAPMQMRGPPPKGKKA